MKALLLLSGGIDSPVAGYLAKKQGISLLALHFSLEPFTDNTAELKSRKLAAMIGCEKFLVASIGNIQAMITKQCTHRYFYVITRRLMLRIAEKIAQQEGCSYLITGDNLGQVGSQTLDNMSVITAAIRKPILRPLLCFNKNETIAIAREIKTYDISKGPEMCSVLGPSNPATTSTVERIESEESRIENYDGIIDDVIRNLNITNVGNQ